MKAHVYQVPVCREGTEDLIHGGLAQRRLYFPGLGVIAYEIPWPSEGVAFFDENSYTINEAENAIKSVFERTEFMDSRKNKYIGEIDIPDELVASIVSEGKNLSKKQDALNEARKSINEKGKSLVRLVNETPPS